MAPPAIKLAETKNWSGPKARAFGTFNMIQLSMFPEILRLFHYPAKCYADFVGADWRNPYINRDKWLSEAV